MTTDQTRKYFAVLMRPLSWPRHVRLFLILLLPLAIPIVLLLLAGTVLLHVLLKLSESLCKFLKTPRRRIRRASIYSYRR